MRARTHLRIELWSLTPGIMEAVRVTRPHFVYRTTLDTSPDALTGIPLESPYRLHDFTVHFRDVAWAEPGWLAAKVQVWINAYASAWLPVTFYVGRGLPYPSGVVSIPSPVDGAPLLLTIAVDSFVIEAEPVVSDSVDAEGVPA